MAKAGVLRGEDWNEVGMPWIGVWVLAIGVRILRDHRADQTSIPTRGNTDEVFLQRVHAKDHLDLRRRIGVFCFATSMSALHRDRVFQTLRLRPVSLM